MNRLAVTLALAAAAACGGGGGNHDKPMDAGIDGGSGSGSATFDQCGGDAHTFVRQAMLAIDGRRPFSEDEVAVYVDLYNAAVARGDDPKATVAGALAAQPEFTERWVDVVMDAMHVQRLDIQTEASCWMSGDRTTTTPALATAVRDQRATAAGDGAGKWTLVDLARSSIALDDISPVYRGELFSLVSHPIPAANVDDVHAELARRADFGTTFDQAYLHRDIVCLACHDSEHSVTDNPDPTLDRFWPVPGDPEKGVYGDATGEDPDVAHAAFRVDSFVGNGNARPWGWDASCGTFAAPASVPTDIAGIDAKFASITGEKATAFDLEASLARGFDALRGSNVPLDGSGVIEDPDVAFAWMVTLKITEDVWFASTGTNLTIANYYPRNEASSDLLYSLATTFVKSKFSLRALLVAIVESNYFDRQAPELACGSGPYTYPNVYDPWVISDPDPAKRLNGPGDAVFPVGARTLVSAANAALSWPAPPDASRFPDYGEPGCETLGCADLASDCQFGECCVTDAAACKDGGLAPTIELPFERGVGMFLRNSERGFAGLDFQARLTWEDRFGACGRPAWTKADFIDALAAAGGSDATATAADLVAALKDRMVGEPAVAAGAEHDAMVAIVGDLAGPASAVTSGQLRQVCAALLESPQFLLGGVAGRGGDRPKLTPTDASYAAVCARVATAGIGATGETVTCSAGGLTLSGGAASPFVRPLAAPRGPRGVPRGLAGGRSLRHVPAHATPRM
nr:hypothetical protein [Kofleriaceae bacterium]